MLSPAENNQQRGMALTKIAAAKISGIIKITLAAWRRIGNIGEGA